MFLLFSTLPQIYLWHSPDATHSFESNFRISLAGGYVALGLLALTLSLGVWRLLKTEKPAVIHFDLRRDVGIWAGIFALLHSFAGLFVHMRSLPYSFLYYFFYEPQRKAAFPIRHDIFGFANYSGLAAALLAVVLLAVSNDYSMRRLGRTRWKNLATVELCVMCAYCPSCPFVCDYRNASVGFMDYKRCRDFADRRFAALRLFQVSPNA